MNPPARKRNDEGLRRQQPVLCGVLARVDLVDSDVFNTKLTTPNARDPIVADIQNSETRWSLHLP